MSEHPKCGTCVSFEVRNRDEALLARIAKTEAECRPGEWVFRGERKVGCHGGPVRGACLRWEEVPLPHPTVESTFHCRLYEEGGPSVRGMGPIPPGGSLNRATLGAVPEAVSNMSGSWLALGALAVLSVAPAVLDRLNPARRFFK